MKSRSSFGTLLGTFMVALPFIFLAQSKVKQTREHARYRARVAEHGQFADTNLTAVAGIIDAGDTNALQRLLTSNKERGVTLNYTQRDRAGETLLGFAATRAMDYDGRLENYDGKFLEAHV